jgi:hypothetical protein
VWKPVLAVLVVLVLVLVVLILVLVLVLAQSQYWRCDAGALGFAAASLLV